MGSGRRGAGGPARLGDAAARRPVRREERRVADLRRRPGAARATRRSIRSTPTNFNKLEVAWRFKTDNLGPRPEFKLEGTPLMVNGVALHDRRHAPRGRRARRRDRRADVDAQRATKAQRGAAAPRQLSGRGLAYWTDGTRRAHPLRDARLPADRARREDRRAGRRLRQERRRRSEARRRPGRSIS